MLILINPQKMRIQKYEGNINCLIQAVVIKLILIQRNKIIMLMF